MLKDYVHFKAFKRVPHCGNFYEISCSGVLRETVGRKEIALFQNTQKEWCVPGNLPEWFAGVSIGLLMAITFRNPTLPVRTLLELELIYKDGHPENHRLTNTIWKCPEGKLSHPLLPGFGYIPGHSRYLISRTGEVISMSKGDQLTPYSDANGYLMYGVQPDVGPRTIVGMHRLLCLTYKPYSQLVDTLDVNHLDGVTWNNELPNLEWASRTRNNLHASENGLNSQSKAVLVRDITTGEVVRYFSIEECGRRLGLGGETIRLRIVNDKQQGKVYSGIYQFKLEDDVSPWRQFDNPLDYTHVTTSRKVKLTVIKTNAQLEFSSIAKLSLYLGEKDQSLRYQLSRTDGKLVYKEYLLEYVS